MSTVCLGLKLLNDHCNERKYMERTSYENENENQVIFDNQ